MSGRINMEGHLNILNNINSLAIDHLNARAFIHSKKINTRYLKIEHELVVPSEPNSIVETTGAIYFNSTTNAFVGYTGTHWMAFGGLTTVDDIYIEKDLYCKQNCNIWDSINTPNLNVLFN